MKKNVLFTCLLMLLLLNTKICWAFFVFSGEKKLNLSPFIEYFIDVSEESKIESVVAGKYDDKFISAENKNLNLGYTRSPIWIRFPLAMGHSDENFILELENPLLQLIDLYYVKKDGEVVKYSSTGIERGYRSRDLPTAMFAWNLYSWPKTPISVYIRIQSITSKGLPLFLWKTDGYYEISKLRENIVSFILGFIIALFIYQLLMGILLKIKENIIFSIIIIESLVIMILAMGGLLKEWPVGKSLFYLQFIVAMYSLFGFLFSRFSRYFYQKNTLLHYSSTALEIVFLCLMPVLFFIQRVGLFTVLILFIISFECFFYITAAIFSRQKGLQGNLLYIIAFIPVVMFLVLRVLKNINLVPDTVITRYGILVAVNITFFLFSLATSYKFKIIKDNSDKNKELAIKRLENLNSIKDKFLTTTAHEIRTPLNGIIGLSETVLEKNKQILNHEDKENLKIVSLSASRLSRLVNDILLNSKDRTGQLEIDKKPFDFKQIVNLVIMNLYPFFEGKGIQIRNKLCPNLPFVNGDVDRIQQVLFNLFGNSLKFTKNGYVLISAEKKGGFLLCCIKDTGIGVSPEKVETVFEEYEQGNENIITEYGGSGLGLSVAKRIIELHNGRIWMDSDIGQGAAVFFTLPVLDNENKPVDSKTEPDTNYQAFPHEYIRLSRFPDNEIDAQGKGVKRIVAIDDEPVNLRVIRNYLPSDKYQIVCLTSDEGLWTYLDGPVPVDLVILDVIIPGESGFAICSEIRKKYSPYELPVLMLTAASSTDNMINSFACGANDYLVKPIMRNELMVRVESHIRLKQNMEKINLSNKKFEEIDKFIQFSFLVSNFISKEAPLSGRNHIDKEKIYNRYKSAIEQYLSNMEGPPVDRISEGKRLFDELDILSPEKTEKLINKFNSIIKEDTNCEYEEADIDRVISDMLELVMVMLVKKQNNEAPVELSIQTLADKYHLTPKEVEVTTLIYRGCSNQEIADELGIVLNTVKQHIYRIFNKVGVDNRTHLIYKLLEL